MNTKIFTLSSHLHIQANFLAYRRPEVQRK